MPCEDFLAGLGEGRVRGHVDGSAIITQDYKSSGKRIRPYETVKPLADELGLKIDHHCDRDDTSCAIKAINSAVSDGAQRVLVCWEHKALDDIAEALGLKSFGM